MKYLLFIGVIIYMFLSTSVAAKIGIMQVGTFSSGVVVFLFFVKLILDDDNILFVKFKEEFNIILIGFLIVLLFLMFGYFKYINSVIFFFIVPMTLSIVLGAQNKSNKKNIRNLILFFFISECLLAVYERLNLINIFPYIKEINESDMEAWSFRSSAILGHPLSNALCVSTIMGFILISQIKLKLKLFYLILGFISLLCFNARAAILIWILLLSIYLINLIRSPTTKKRVVQTLILFLLVIIYLIYILIVEYGFGGRIVHDDINDGSAKARIDVYSVFSYVSNIDLWYGNPSNYLPLMKKLHAAGIENSYIVLILNYGILMFSIIIFFYYRLIGRFIKHYSLYFNFIILTSFLVVGSTNNALVSSMPWVFLILCFHSFPIFKRDNI